MAMHVCSFLMFYIHVDHLSFLPPRLLSAHHVYRGYIAKCDGGRGQTQRHGRNGGRSQFLKVFAFFAK